MRTIKFRGKSLLNKKWIYGCLIKHNSIVSKTSIVTESIADYRDCFVIDNTVGQFTGLYDKNGNEIYEGDIIEIDDEMYAKVVWDKERARFEYQLFRPIHIVNTFHEFNMPYLLVVGNIHDNPELLKQQEL